MSIPENMTSHGVPIVQTHDTAESGTRHVHQCANVPPQKQVCIDEEMCLWAGAMQSQADSSAERAARLAQPPLARPPDLDKLEEFLFARSANLPISADALRQLRHVNLFPTIIE